MKRQPTPKDPLGGHIRLYWIIYDSPAWRALTHADVRVYMALRRQLKATNNGDITATLAVLKHSGITSSSTISAALHRLEAVGLIEKTRQGGIAFGGKLCSLYRFTDVETFDIAKAGVKAGPATNEWQRFKTLAHARAVVNPYKRKNTSKVRTSHQSASISESDGNKSDSTGEQVSCVPLRKANQDKTYPTHRKAA